jgi:hypothetical protein
MGSSDRRENPNWAAMGYSGPEESPSSVTKEYMYSMINCTMNEDCTLDYDVVVVGSGCGGEVFRGANLKSGLLMVCSLIRRPCGVQDLLWLPNLLPPVPPCSSLKKAHILPGHKCQVDYVDFPSRKV